MSKTICSLLDRIVIFSLQKEPLPDDVSSGMASLPGPGKQDDGSTHMDIPSLPAVAAKPKVKKGKPSKVKKSKT